MNTKLKALALICGTAALYACGGGGSSSGGGTNNDGGDGGGDAGGSGEVRSGQFVDSAVANTAYTASPSGTTGFTDENGFFDFESGDTVTFSVRGVDLPPVPATGKVTINDFDKVSTSDSDDLGLNIAILLQSLDSDGDASNGIQIPDETEETADKAANVDFDQPVNDFVSDTETGVQAALVEGDSAPVTADAAKEHLDSQMEDLLLSGTGVWRLYVIGDDPGIRNVTFNDDGTINYTNVQEGGWYNPVDVPEENTKEEYSSTAKSLQFGDNPDEFTLVYEGVGEENGEKWDVLVFAESATTLIYMDNRPTDLHDLGNLSAEAGDDWNLLIVNDEGSGVVKEPIGFRENGQTAPGDYDTTWENNVDAADFFNDEEVSSVNDPILGVLRGGNEGDEAYLLNVSGGDLSLLYIAVPDGEGFAEQYSLMTENEGLADSILNAMQ